jgi:hypothetical protein
MLGGKKALLVEFRCRIEEECGELVPIPTLCVKPATALIIIISRISSFFIIIQLG